MQNGRILDLNGGFADEKREADLKERLKAFEPKKVIVRDIEKLIDAIVTEAPNAVILPLNEWVKVLQGGENGSMAGAMIRTAIQYEGYVLGYIAPIDLGGMVGFTAGLRFGTEPENVLRPFASQEAMRVAYEQGRNEILAGETDGTD